MANDERLFNIYIADVPFDQSNKSKVRPALLIEVDAGKAIVYKITSKYEKKSKKIKTFYYPIVDWKEAHLLKKSYIDIHKAYRLPQEIVFKHPPIGMLSQYDVIRLFDFANNFWTNKKNKTN